MEQTEIYNFLIAVFIGLIVLLLLVGLALRLEEFKRDLKYVKTEIKRTRGSERRAWQKEKRRLWLSLIPFYKR